MALVLFIALLALLALLTAYTRNFQRTVVDLDHALDGGGRLLPRMQTARTLAVSGGWPLALGLGLMFIAWWKVVAVVVGSFLLLVPVLGSLTPRPSSPHFVQSIRDDLARRIDHAGAERTDLERLQGALDRRLSGTRGGDRG